MSTKDEVLVIGAGVIGLTSAIRLLEAGHPVRVLADRTTPHTTSNIAGAMWFPYAVEPEELAYPLALRSLDVFLEQVDRVPGVHLMPAVHLEREWIAEPSWKSYVKKFRPADASELPPGFACGFAFETVVARMDDYMPWLMGRFDELGGTLEGRHVTGLHQLDAPTVVNCAGLAGQSIRPDPRPEAATFPIRGQLVRAENPGIERVLIDEDLEAGVMAYVVPRGEDVILGGTKEPHVGELTTDDEMLDLIVDRCIALDERLRTARRLDARVGLRPGATALQLGAERLLTGQRAIHNYGHGGAGMTLSWACAETVVDLVENVDATQSKIC